MVAVKRADTAADDWRHRADVEEVLVNPVGEQRFEIGMTFSEECAENQTRASDRRAISRERAGNS